MTEQTNALVPSLGEDVRRDALLKALGFDKLSEGQRELALSIATRYDLDPMLRHLVMIDGKPYITRDGLLHVAHNSKDFDGIEVDPPTLDADGKWYRTMCRVYRKSFSRPFTYPGRYPATGGNSRYNEEMCIKIGEVMTLRRAFDVSAPTVEERWDEAETSVPETTAPTTLADKIAQRALAVGGSEGQPTADTESEVVEAVVTEVEQRPASTMVFAVSAEEMERAGAALAGRDVEPEPEPEPEPVKPTRQRKPKDETPQAGTFVAPSGGFGADPTKVVEPDPEPTDGAVTDDASPMDLFKAWAQYHDRDLIRSAARAMFPDKTSFGDLDASQLGAIQQAVERGEKERDAEASSMSTSQTCGAESPLSGTVCTLAAAHRGVHNDGSRESW